MSLISREAREHSLTSLLDALGRNRRTLIVVYLVMMIGVLLMLLRLGPLVPEWIHYFRGLDSSDIELLELGSAIFMLLLFFAAQAAFLWGGGRVTLGKEPAGVWRLLIPIGIVAAMLTLVCWSGIGLLFEIFDRAGSQGSLRGKGLSDVLGAWFEQGGSWWWLLSPVWLFWLLTGLYLLRARDQLGALGRLLAALLAGSWIEFLIALPVDIAVRERAEMCPCATGSWLALLLAIPICLFVFGPGLVLLYLRELRLAGKEPNRVLRVLVRKSRRQSGAA